MTTDTPQRPGADDERLSVVPDDEIYRLRDEASDDGEVMVPADVLFKLCVEIELRRYDESHAELSRLRSPSEGGVMTDPSPGDPADLHGLLTQTAPWEGSPSSADMVERARVGPRLAAEVLGAWQDEHDAAGPASDPDFDGLEGAIGREVNAALSTVAREAREAAIADCCAAICFGCAHGWETGYNEQYDPDHRTLMHKAPGATELGHKCDASAIRALSGTAPQAGWRAISMPAGWRLVRVWDQSLRNELDNDWMAELQFGTANRYVRNSDGSVGHATPDEAITAAINRAVALPSPPTEDTKP